MEAPDEPRVLLRPPWPLRVPLRHGASPQAPTSNTPPARILASHASLLDGASSRAGGVGHRRCSGTGTSREMVVMLHVALACVAQQPDQRPSGRRMMEISL